MEKKDLIGLSTIGVLFIISILGFIPEENDNYVCVEDEISMYCDHLSGSGRTCYPNLNNRTGSKLCSETWLPIDRSDLNSTIANIKFETDDGTLIDCELNNNILKENSYCYYDNRKHFRSEFT